MLQQFKYVLCVFVTILLLVGCSSKPDRGSYTGSYYTVQKNDTLYFISYITNKNMDEIIKLNHLKSPYVIHPGQRINLWNESYVAPSYGQKSQLSNATNSIVNNGSNKSRTSVETSSTKGYVRKNQSQANNKKSTLAEKSTNNPNWRWPTKGNIISQFSLGETGNKGIDIVGSRGQSILSTANGTVVYAGNALRGYGNLIIIKHNEEYLSAYAHNDKLLISEGQSVKAGQKIALMGSTGAKDVRLHFEIRYKGQSVNPERYLP